MFNPTRLKLARKRRGLSKKQLTEITHLSIQTLSDWENGKAIPKSDNLEELAKVLNFPLGFFSGQTIDELPLEKVSFRALTKMKSSTRDAVTASGELAVYLNSWLESKFSLPMHDIKHINGETPKEAAIRLKKEWDINTSVIANTIHLLEKHGVRVYSLVEDSRDVDAFSVWHNNIPFVFLNTLKSAERSRFDAMHELGHLVLHPLGIPRDKKSEFEANSFAAEMLMPENSFVNVDIKFPTIPNLIKLKKNWKVSLKAIIYRLNELGLITEWSNRSLLIELNKKGYDKSEPESIERETSYLLAKIFKILSEDNITINSIAEELCLSPIEIHKLVFNLFKPISGGKISSDKEKSSAHLRLVDSN